MTGGSMDGNGSNGDREEAKRTVLQAIAGVAPDTDPEAIDPTEDMWYALDLDSMDQLGVMIAIGERTGVEVPEADYPGLVSLDDLVDYLARAGT